MDINETLRFLGAGMPMPLRLRVEQGDFTGAVRLIDEMLQGDLTETMRHDLTARRQICSLMPASYPYTVKEALALIREKLPTFTEEEFDALLAGRCFDAATVDGETHVLDSFLDTLMDTDRAFAERVHRAEDPSYTPGNGGNMRTAAMDGMALNGSAACRITLRATIRLKDELFTPGMFLRAHLPIPAVCDTQTDVEILSLCPNSGSIAPGNALQRAVCWEGRFDENPTFTAEYRYVHREPYVDPGTLRFSGEEPSFFTEEELPHIAFTPYVRAIRDELTAGAADPLEKAWRIYDYMTTHMHYSYQPPYILMEQIPEKCLRDLTGDCGVFALTFITLLRSCGIPAVWQSGLAGCDRPAPGSHDWVRFYIAPYGWLQSDVTWGMTANKQGLEKLRRFYFCNIDPTRMVANNAFQAPFTVPKRHWRNDPYDNQRGEIETDDRGFTEADYVTSQTCVACEAL